jgi:hypothetical protein
MPSATPLAIVCPDFVESGKPFSVTATFRNDGPETWLANGAGGWHLGSQLPQDNGTWGTGRWNLSANVPPGASVPLTLSGVAPTLDPTFSQPPMSATTPLPLFSGALPLMPIPFAVKMVQDGGAGWFGGIAASDVVVTIPMMPPPALRPSPDLIGMHIFSTGAFVSGGRRRRCFWRNPYPVALRIARFDCWIGVDAGCPGMDLYAWLMREDGSSLAHYWWDHYGQPNAPVIRSTYFTPPAVLEPNEALILQTLGGSVYNMNALGFITCAV